MEWDADHSGTPPSASFPADGGHYPHENSQEPHFHGGRHQTDQRYAPNFHGEQNDSDGFQMNGTSNSSSSLPPSGQKRPFSHSNSVGSGSYVKLYVVGISRSSTEQDIRAFFGEHGQILEVVLLKDKKTGLQQEACFVKYATLEQAERAIGAFHGPHTFPGASIPMKVKFADGERERLGIHGVHIHKLYVGCINRQAEKSEIEEIFSPFGIIEDVFMVRDEFKQSRGCAFVQYLYKSMALAAIQALNGTYVMRGCDQPLIVRFAEPKRPRVGDSSFSRPTHVNGTANGHMMSNEVQHIKFVDSECKMATIANNGSVSASHAFNKMDGEPSIECDWSEHVSPDGDLYYYNCVTCESKWEKPEEYAFYEKQLDNLGEQQLQPQELR